MKQAAVKIKTMWGYEVNAEKLCMSVVLGNDNKSMKFRIEAIEGSNSIAVESFDSYGDFEDAFRDITERFIKAQTQELLKDKKRPWE